MGDGKNGEARHFVVLSSVGHGVNDVYWFLFALLMPVIQSDLGLSYTQRGLLLTLYLTVTAAFSYLTGMLSDYWGRRPVLAGGFLVTALALLATSVTGSYKQLMFMLVIVGVGVSSFHPAAYAAINEAFEARRGRVYGVFEAAGSVGVLVALLVLGTLMKTMAWRQLVSVVAVPAAILAVVLGFARGWGGTGRATRRLSQESSSSLASKRLTPGDRQWIVQFFLGLTLRTLGITAIVHFTPTYLVDVVGLKTWIAGYASTVVFTAGVVTAWITGVMADQKSPMTLVKVVAVATVPVMVLIGSVQNLAVLGLFLALLGAFWLGMYPPLNLVVTTLGAREDMGMMFGILTCLNALVNAFGPGLVGALADRIGLTLALWYASIPILIGAYLLVRLDSRRFMRSDAEMVLLKEQRIG